MDNKILNSYLIGNNMYRVLPVNKPQYLEIPLPNSSSVWNENKNTYKILPINADKDSSILWLIPLELDDMQKTELQNTVEQLIGKALFADHFFVPFDIAGNNDLYGLIIRPINLGEWKTIREITLYPDASKNPFEIAKDIFQKLELLHKMGFSLGGFSRQQVWISARNNAISFLVGHHTRSVSNQKISKYYYEDGYLSIPNYYDDELKKKGITLNGKQRDIFSAAILAFYLIYYTHPFIGGAYSSLALESYHMQYQNHPEFIFCGNDSNALGMMEHERVIEERWELSSNSLQKMFSKLFSCIAKGSKECDSDSFIWNISEWIQCIEESELYSEHMPDYDFRHIYQRV